MAKKICKICGKEYFGKRNSKYCSRECYYKSEERPIEKICSICNKKYITYQYLLNMKKGQYCSRKCANKAQHKYNEIEIKENYAEIIIASPKFGEQRAIIDLEDVEKCKEYTWTLSFCKPSKCFYVETTKSLGGKNQKHFSLHQFIMDFPNNKSIDHINHNPLDNRKENLKVCTHFENMQNKKIKASSGYVGITYYPKRNRWVAKITVKRKHINLGTFDNLEDAIKARKEGVEKYFGS